MIEAHELTKRYGDTIAVHSLSFTIAPGTVTGFLGPNGVGKSTTMRMIMGLDRPTSGTVTVNGKPYRQHRAPLREVGGLLEASAVHPGRSARSHLRTMAATHNIKASRVSEVIEMTGLAGVATRIRGKGRTSRTVKIGHQAARSLDRYLRARARHPQSWRPQLWLGVNGRGPLTAGGIYQAVARRGRQAGVTVYPHRFRHHFSHTWLDRGGANGRDLMELNDWTSPQMLTRYAASARGARARRSYDRIMDDTT